MKLFVFMPREYNKYALYVVAETEAAARTAIELEIKRRMEMTYEHPEFEDIVESESVYGWESTDHYATFTVWPGQVFMQVRT